MVLGMRAKGALPWMLDFVGNGPMFVPRPTYNPNPSAGLYHSRQVLSFDVTGPHRYLPMIHALKRHKVRRRKKENDTATNIFKKRAIVFHGFLKYQARKILSFLALTSFQSIFLKQIV